MSPEGSGSILDADLLASLDKLLLACKIITSSAELKSGHYYIYMICISYMCMIYLHFLQALVNFSTYMEPVVKGEGELHSNIYLQHKFLRKYTL